MQQSQIDDPPPGADLTLLGQPLEMKRMIYEYLFKDARLRIPDGPLTGRSSGDNHKSIKIPKLLTYFQQHVAALLVVFRTSRAGRVFFFDALAVLAANCTLEIGTAAPDMKVALSKQKRPIGLRKLPQILLNNITTIECRPDYILRLKSDKLVPKLRIVKFIYDCSAAFTSCRPFLKLICNHRLPDCNMPWLSTLVKDMNVAKWDELAARVVAHCASRTWKLSTGPGHVPVIMVYFTARSVLVKKRFEVYFDLSRKLLMKQFLQDGETLLRDKEFARELVEKTWNL